MKKLFLLVCIVGSAICANASTHVDEISTLKSMPIDADLLKDKLEKKVFSAVAYGSLKELKKLLESGADSNMPLNAGGSYGDTPLMIAVEQGYEDKVALLLEYRADPNFYTNDRPPLVLAVKRMSISIAKMLLGAKAMVDKPTQKERITPLLQATMNNNCAMAALFYSVGANATLTWEQNRTAFDIAREASFDDILMLLVTGFDDFCASPLDFLSRMKNAWQERGGRGFIYEIKKENRVPGDLKPIKSFDDMGALYLRYCAQMGNPFLMQLLLDFGADIENPLAEKNSLIMYAIASQDPATVDLLKSYCPRWLLGKAYEWAKSRARVHGDPYCNGRCDKEKYAAESSMHTIHGSLISLRAMATVACLNYRFGLRFDK